MSIYQIEVTLRTSETKYKLIVDAKNTHVYDLVKAAALF